MPSETLAEFLLARIAEDEAHLDAEVLNDFPPTGACWKRLGDDRVCIRPRGHDVDSARVLAECEAKRRIVGMQAQNDEDRYLPGFHYKAQMIERVLRALAMPYADHPDYREEWRS